MELLETPELSTKVPYTFLIFYIAWFPVTKPVFRLHVVLAACVPVSLYFMPPAMRFFKIISRVTSLNMSASEVDELLVFRVAPVNSCSHVFSLSLRSLYPSKPSLFVYFCWPQRYIPPTEGKKTGAIEQVIGRLNRFLSLWVSVKNEVARIWE